MSVRLLGLHAGRPGPVDRGEGWTLLKEICGEDEAFFDLQVRLLGIEQSHRCMSRRAEIFEKLEKRLRAGIYATEQEAVLDLSDREQRRDEARGRAKTESAVQVRPAETQLGLLREDLDRTT